MTSCFASLLTTPVPLERLPPPPAPHREGAAGTALPSVNSRLVLLPETVTPGRGGVRSAVGAATITGGGASPVKVTPGARPSPRVGGPAPLRPQLNSSVSVPSRAETP